MTEVTREMMREEAIARLKILEKKGLHPNVLREFEADGTVNCSQRAAFGGAAVGVLYWMDGDSEWAEKVREFEENNDALVYHATAESFVEIGRMLDLFYVSAHEEEWEMDRNDLEGGRGDFLGPLFDESEKKFFKNLRFEQTPTVSVRFGRLLL